MSIIDDIKDTFRFKDTIIAKGTSNLDEQYKALLKLSEEFPNNNKILNELNNVKKGTDGEKEVLYQLKKANIGMYVLRDVILRYEDLKAQIDLIVITPLFTYYIECKNLYGNIIVNEKGDFINEYTYNGKQVRKGMESPLTQVEKQRDVVKKIWESRASKFTRLLAEKHFNHYRKAIMVAANRNTIIDTSKAPADIKYRVLRADGLVRQIEYDYMHRDKDDVLFNKKQIEEAAQTYIDLCDKYPEDWYMYYKDLFCNDTSSSELTLKDKLRDFRRKRANEMNYPLYYVFNNEEMDKIVEIKPKNIEELYSILSPIKVKVHGEEILRILKGD